MDATREQIQAAIGRAQADGNAAAVSELTAALGQLAQTTPEPSRMQLVDALGRAQADGNAAAAEEIIGAIHAQEARGPAPQQMDPIADRFSKIIPALKAMAGGVTPWADEAMAGVTSLTSGRPFDQELARHRSDMRSLPERDRNALQYTGMGVGMLGGAKALGAAAGAAPGLLKFGGIPLGMVAGGLQGAGAGETQQERYGMGILGAGLGGATAGLASIAVPVLSGVGRRVAGAFGSKNPFNAAGGRGAERVFRDAAEANPGIFINPSVAPLRNEGLSEVSRAVLQRGGPNAAKIIEAGKALRNEAAGVASTAANAARLPGARVVSEAKRAADAANAYAAAGLPQAGKPPVVSPVYGTVLTPESVGSKMVTERILQPGRKIPSMVTRNVQTKTPAVQNDLGEALKQPGVRRVVRDLPESVKSLPDGDMRKLHEIAKGVRFRADAATDPVQKAAAKEARAALMTAIEKRNPAYAAAVREYGNDTRLMDAFSKGYSFDKASAPTSYKVGQMKPDTRAAYTEGVIARTNSVVATSSSPGAAAKALGVRKSEDFAEAFKDNPDVLEIITSRLKRAEDLDKLGKALAPDSVLAARSEAPLPSLVPNVASSNVVGGALRGAGQVAAHAGQILKFGKKTNRVVGKVLTDPKAAPYLAALLESKRSPMVARGTAIGAGMQALDILEQLRERYGGNS